MNYQQKAILELAKVIKSKGFKVFTAASLTHGFYTDLSGDKVISFDYDGGFSGNYRTNLGSQTGTGWNITKFLDDDDYPAMLASYPPYWAVGDSDWSYTTLKQYLKTYQSACKFTEI